MTWIGTSGVNWIMQGVMILIVSYFLYRQWKIYKGAEVGGQTGRFSKLALMGLGFLLLSELFALAVLYYQMPYFWVKLYYVTPKITGILFIFIGLIGLLRSFGVFDEEEEE